MSEEVTRDEAWHKARKIAFAKIDRVLAKANAGRPKKPSILELNLAEAQQMLEEKKEPIARQNTIKMPPAGELSEVDW